MHRPLSNAAELRSVLQGLEIGDEVGPIGVFAQSGKRHLGSREIGFRVEDKRIQSFDVPDSAKFSHG